MIAILFEKNSVIFDYNGIGRLTDCIDCRVTEERNGVFDLEMIYPTVGVLYE